VVSRQNADIADTLHLRDVAIATTFWLSMGFNYSCAWYLILGVVFWSQANQWRHSWDWGSDGRCDCNYFFSFIYMGCTLAPPG